MSEIQYRAAVVIPTFNRKDHLRQALHSALAQTIPMELIVMDDGSTDGTAEMVRSEFPQAIFEQHAGPNGPTFLRNRGSQLATAPILFPIDDDAVFVSSKTVEQTLADFDHPRVGAVGIPFINVRINQTVNQRAAKNDDIEITQAYIGAAHALRRDLFLKLGGYRTQLFYMGEENDYCIRMLEAGYVTRLGRADEMHHFESPLRNLYRADFYNRRNDVLFAIHNVPMPQMIVRMATTVFAGIRFGLRVHRTPVMVRGLMAGHVAAVTEWRNRQTVQLKTYRLFRRLRLVHHMLLEEVEAELAPL